jgi:hypothetical protein
MAQMSQVTMFSPRFYVLLSLFSCDKTTLHSANRYSCYFTFIYFPLSAPFLFFPTIRHFVTMWAVRNVSTSNPKSRLLRHTIVTACMLFSFLKRYARAEFNMAHKEQLADFVNWLHASHLCMLIRYCGWFWKTERLDYRLYATASISSRWASFRLRMRECRHLLCWGPSSRAWG